MISRLALYLHTLAFQLDNGTYSTFCICSVTITWTLTMVEMQCVGCWERENVMVRKALLPSQFNQRERERKRQTHRQTLIIYAANCIIIIWDEWREGITPVTDFLISWQTNNNSQAPAACLVLFPGTSHWWSHMVEDADLPLDEQPLTSSLLCSQDA